mgnify:CR=1 FL=1
MQNRSHIAPVGSNRMSLANVSKGRIDKPLRVCVFGTPGVGKSTFAAAAPRPIFLCAEDGTSHLDVERFPQPASWQDALDALTALLHDEHPYKTLAVDTLDWLEPLCWKQVAQDARVADVEQIPYGKGYAAAVALWRLFLGRLDTLVRTRRMNVILLAHAVIKRVDDPQTGPFDRYRIPLHEKSADLIREWVDALLFARHEVRTVERNGKVRGMSSGNRLLHTTWTAAYDAKNRFDLPETLPLSWEDFESACKAHVPADPAKLRAEIESLLPQLDEETRGKAVDYLGKHGTDPAKLAQLADRVRSKVVLQGEGGGES